MDKTMADLVDAVRLGLIKTVNELRNRYNPEHNATTTVILEQALAQRRISR